ncbi:MAG TPA: hypothetical protein PKW33_01860 [Anaerolineaceae bacterium]|nr:hypothetical protein [Anaerolineaceae bacterium]HPN50304.1 hypothetical protein [Anaerolineaceae bacterium]
MKRWIPIAIFLLLITLPYLAAWGMQGDQFVFGGFLMNVADGNSYLAKMRQGWEGAWLFHLPFSAEPGEGAFIFLFYLGLGHLARLTGLPLLAVFHLARVAGAGFMAWALARFYRQTLPEMEKRINPLMLTALLSGGMGWILLPGGVMTSDYWVAEAYPYLAGYANPHFPLALGLILCLLTDDGAPMTLSQGLRLLGLSLGLVTVLPFAWMVAGALLLVWLGVNWKGDRRRHLMRLAWVCMGAAPMLGYQFWVYQFDPVFQAWNAQNQTVSPPLWDFIISFLPMLALAGVGAYFELRAKQASPARLLVVWLLAGIVLCYVPFSLQRRFMMGYMIPVAGLGMLGLEKLVASSERRWRLAFVSLLAAGLLTNVLGLTGASLGILGHHPGLYLSRDEAAVYRWIDENTPPNALVLADPASGLRLPGWTGRRVIYGHPFETIQAEKEEAFVTAFFSGRMSFEESQQALAERGVDFIFYDPHAEEAGRPAVLNDRDLVFQSGEVAVYRVKQP